MRMCCFRKYRFPYSHHMFSSARTDRLPTHSQFRTHSFRQCPSNGYRCHMRMCWFRKYRFPYSHHTLSSVRTDRLPAHSLLHTHSFRQRPSNGYRCRIHMCWFRKYRFRLQHYRFLWPDMCPGLVYIRCYTQTNTWLRYRTYTQRWHSQRRDRLHLQSVRRVFRPHTTPCPFPRHCRPLRRAQCLRSRHRRDRRGKHSNWDRNTPPRSRYRHNPSLLTMRCQSLPNRCGAHCRHIRALPLQTRRH